MHLVNIRLTHVHYYPLATNCDKVFFNPSTHLALEMLHLSH